jgi:hypothetical protein
LLAVPWVADCAAFEKVGWAGPLASAALAKRAEMETKMATPAFEEIAETFEFLDDWEDRYRHVIDLGRAMPELEPSFKVPAL